MEKLMTRREQGSTHDAKQDWGVKYSEVGLKTAASQLYIQQAYMQAAAWLL